MAYPSKKAPTPAAPVRSSIVEFGRTYKERANQRQAEPFDGLLAPFAYRPQVSMTQHST
jgi:hypothetical protein